MRDLLDCVISRIAQTQAVSTSEARKIGDKLGIDWGKVDIKQFARGLEVEQEHGPEGGKETDITHDDPLTVGKIAWAHLKEISDYYDRLEKMEAEAED